MINSVAVIDIGKTNAKVLVIDLSSGRELATRKRANQVLSGPPYPHFDAEGLWQFILHSLADLARDCPIEAISITTHGACAALVDAAGGLALPILDYEHDGPEETRADYDALRPDFAETGSARLPGGLNLGAQLFWQARRFPAEFAAAAHVLTYPQYWAFRLTGRAASEATSLGCHTDLWNPWQGRFSSLPGRAATATGLDWAGKFPPVLPAAECLGAIRAEIAQACGLAPDLPVYCGIHDSNASLVPYLGAEAPFAVVSSGTWMITLAIGARPSGLDAARDTLVNVNAKGEPTPTARYMGGREFEELTKGQIVTPTGAELARVLRDRVMVLPSLHPETGPFPGLTLGWTSPPATPGECCAAAAFYVALMVAECLDLIGAGGPVHVEGPFGGNAAFAAMLATATGRQVVSHGKSAGTGLGAALLAGRARPAPAATAMVAADPALAGYATEWQAKVAAVWAARQAR